MSRLLPSQAVEAIEALFPDVLRPRAAAQPPPVLGVDRSNDVSAVLAVVESVPNELVQLSGRELSDLIIACAKARDFIVVASHSRPAERLLAGMGPTLSGGVIDTILSSLRRCADQAVPASTAELAFLDPQLRDGLRQDIAEVERAIVDGEWKSATVVCGSVVEALLLWRLSHDPAAARASASRLATTKRAEKLPLDEWDLHHYLEVAAELGLLNVSDTVPQLRLAKDFRNLIHPGAAQRLARKCDRSTALAAVAGLGFLIRDLT